MAVMPSWPAGQFSSHPLYAVLGPVLARLGWQRFPDADAWAALGHLPDGPRNRQGMALRFVAPDAQTARYEQAVWTLGKVATRPGNFHDMFNALVWMSFPRAKAALNELHYQELCAAASPLRSRRRDWATLLDESGIILACSAGHVVDSLRQHDWIGAFVQGREQWGRTIQPFVFGHSIFDIGLKPFSGFTGKALPVVVEPAFFRLALAQQLDLLDERVADIVRDGSMMTETGRLSPLPLLGIPGWCKANEAPGFYQNTDYFRPGRQ